MPISRAESHNHHSSALQQDFHPKALLHDIFVSADKRFPQSNIHVLLQDALGPLSSAFRFVVYHAATQLHQVASASMPEDRYFNSNIQPNPDNEYEYNEPLILRRHAWADRDGFIIERLRHLGVETLGELQTILLYWTCSLRYGDAQTPIVHTDSLYRPILAVLQLLSTHDPSHVHAPKEQLQDYALDVVYHKSVVHFLQKHTELVHAFIASDSFQKLSREFQNAHIAAHHKVSSNETIAIAMLAGHYLFKFERTSANHSPSQRFLSNPDVYHAHIEEFIRTCCCITPPEPCIYPDDVSLVSQKVLNLNALKQTDVKTHHTALLSESVEEPTSLSTDSLPRLGPKDAVSKTQQQCETIASTFEEQCLTRMKHEIHRKKVEDKLFTLIEKRAPWMIIDPKRRRTLMQTLIGNFFMLKVDTQDGPQYTAKDWLPFTDGYLGADNTDPIPDIVPPERETTMQDLVAIIKDIFDGQTGLTNEQAYRNQVQKIYQYTPQILAFLLHNALVPESLQTLTGVMMDRDALSEKFLARSGPPWEQDINTVNRFLAEGGLDLAQKVMLYSQVFDFIRGIETNVVLSTQPLSKKLKHMFRGKWRKYDFSSVGDLMLSENILITIKDGEHRVRMLNNDKKTKSNKKGWVLKDWLEFLELVFGWDTHDMKFLRWSSYWDIYNVMFRISDDCICRYRKNLYNTMMLQQA